jgi:formylglycine-generating enzyme required for sulfatase activity
MMIGISVTTPSIAELPTRTIAGSEFIRFPEGKQSCDAITIAATAGELSATQKVVHVKAFWLATTEVTVGEFARFCSATQYKTEAEAKGALVGIFSRGNPTTNEFSWRHPAFDQTEEHPVTCLTYADMEAYCKWLSGNQPGIFRLPTTVEWEYACLFGANTQYNFSDIDDASQFVNVADRSLSLFEGKGRKWSFDDHYVHTAPVNAKARGDNGLYFMHGNVAEMCELVPEVIRDDDKVKWEAIGIARGGAWNSSLETTAGPLRIAIPKGIAFNFIGCRLAWDDEHR